MPDPYTNPDLQPESAIQAMSTRLEDRGRNRDFLSMILKYGSTLSTTRPLKILDLGCGTGVVIRQIAEKVHPRSSLHGADISAKLLREAERLAPNSSIQWYHLSPGPLPYDDGMFDVIIMHTLLSHVTDPRSILREANRVLNKEGRLIVFDADHAGTTYSLPDYPEMRRIDHLLSSAIATHPDICRQMPRLLKETGFVISQHEAAVISECGKGDYWLSSVQGFARLIPTLGVLSSQEAESWVNQMIGSHEEGTFFAAGVFYTFHAIPAQSL